MKKKWILLAEGLLLAVLFVLSFGGSDIVFEADHQQLYRVEETGGIVSKDFALNPGVYRIIVESDIANGGIGSGMEISLEAEETTFRAIRATGQLCLRIQSIKGLPIMWQIRLMQHICRYSHFRREEMFPMS